MKIHSLFSLLGLTALGATTNVAHAQYEGRHVISSLKNDREIQVGYFLGRGDLAGHESKLKSGKQFTFKRHKGYIWCLVVSCSGSKQHTAVTRLSANDVRRVDNLFAFYNSHGGSGSKEGKRTEYVVIESNFSTGQRLVQLPANWVWQERYVLPFSQLATQAFKSDLGTSAWPPQKSHPVL